jgi:uncharacterized Zn-finger protein
VMKSNSNTVDIGYKNERSCNYCSQGKKLW